jgi:hypothetical protein
LASQVGDAPKLITTHLRQRQIQLTIKDGRLNQAAADWFRSEAAAAQYLFIGEEHDTREIPLIAGGLWRELVPLGYRHVAIEAGQWLGGRLDRFARFADVQALAQFTAATWPRRPQISVPPIGEEDIVFYESLGRPSRLRTPTDTALIWGLDHEFRVTPLLKRLVELTPDLQRRLRVEAILAKVRAAESAGAFNMQPFKTELTALARMFRPPSGTEVAQILDAIKRRTFGDKYDQERDDVFKELFLRNYRAAQRAGGARPRVMLRFGSYHGKRGLMSDFGNSTLANFVAEFAYLEGARMLNVIFISCADAPQSPGDQRRPCEPRENGWLKPFAEAANYRWTLFDVRGLRELLGKGELRVGCELYEILAGFDAVVLLKDSARAHFSQ